VENEEVREPGVPEAFCRLGWRRGGLDVPDGALEACCRRGNV
jgi:hypothetical protein